MKPRLAISFSGGRSSAVMLWICLQKYAETHDILITFANTGCEDNRTLDFVDAVDRHIAGGRVVWVEAVTHHGERKGCTHKIVDFATAARNGEPFEGVVKKYGLPNPSFPHCTRETKLNPMKSYLRSVGWETGSYDSAIGIRADEIDRCSAKAKEQRLIYPLVEEQIRRADVNAWCNKQEWDLKIPGDHYGNCTWCWKKTDRKLYTLAVDAPEVFSVPRRLEQYSNCGAGGGESVTMFRHHRNVADIIREASQKRFAKYQDDNQLLLFDNELDIGSGCGESCEIGADE